MSARELRLAARRALSEHGSSLPPTTRVGRVVVEVVVDGRSELVTLSLRDGELVSTASDGRTDGPHVVAALSFVASEEMELEAEDAAAGHKSSKSSPGTIPPPSAAKEHPIASAIDDVLTAVVRLGAIEAHDSPSVDETIERLLKVAPTPLPYGLSRWIGRLRTSLADRDVDHLARLMDGASRVVGDLTLTPANKDSKRRVGAWLAPTRVGDVDTITDCVLVEVGREILSGATRGALERRYLVEPSSGEVYREERRRPTEDGSVGPCPRQVAVGLAEVERGPAPRRVRLLQYAVTPKIATPSWRCIAEMAVRDFGTLAKDYRDALKSFPALAEPFAILAPAKWERAEGLVPLDAEDRPLPLAKAGSPGALSALEKLTTDQDPAWVAGRVIDVDGDVLLEPFSVAFGEAASIRFHRLR